MLKWKNKMIMFDFECGECGHIYEQLISHVSIALCKNCAADKNQKRLISPPKIVKATANNQPKTQEDLANYWGNGSYRPGYKPSFTA